MASHQGVWKKQITQNTQVWAMASTSAIYPGVHFPEEPSTYHF